MRLRRKNKEVLEEEEQISELELLLKKRQIPILTLDTRWHQLFPEENKSDDIKKRESEVNHLLKNRGKTTNEIEELKKLKSKLMQNIVDNMQQADGEDEKQRERMLEKSQQLIKEANRKLNFLEKKQGDIPEQLENANERLLTSTIEECYEKMDGNKEELEEITVWITEIREELKRKLIMKQELEEQNALIYSTLHDMLGAEIMQYFDTIYGEN